MKQEVKLAVRFENTESSNLHAASRRLATELIDTAITFQVLTESKLDGPDEVHAMFQLHVNENDLDSAEEVIGSLLDIATEYDGFHSHLFSVLTTP